MKWIKCSERLPEFDQKILFIDHRGYKFYGWRKKEEFNLPESFEQEVECSISCCYGPRSFEPEEIKYWIPYPELPTD